jgi:hypothetical protein
MSTITLFLLKGFGIQGVVLGRILGYLLGLALYSISVSRSGALVNLAFKFTQIISKLLRFSTPLYAASLVSLILR